MLTLMGSGSGLRPPTTQETGFRDPSEPFLGPLGILDPLAAERRVLSAYDTNRLLERIDDVAGGTGIVALRSTTEFSPQPPSNN